MINKRVKNAKMIFSFMVPLTFAAFCIAYLTIKDYVKPDLAEFSPFDIVSEISW